MAEEKENKKDNNEKEDEKKEVEVPKEFKDLIEKIEKMSVADLARLVKVLEEKFGVSAAPQVVSVSGGGQAGGSNGQAAAEEEKSVFNIELKEVGAKKIEVIKVIRDLTGKGLKESKDLVDAAEKEPQVVRENVKKDEAKEIQKKLEEAGAKVELK
ncbi:50S ribosomal protein L7/L12 [bacterium]|nr:50S ribosomal protein L7/L12 [bacterium]